MEMLSIYDLWTSFQSTVNTFQGGWFRPTSDFTTKVNDIANDLFIKYTNEAEKSQKARDALFFLLKSENRKCRQSNSNYSIVDMPEKYERFAGMSILFHGDKTYQDPDVQKCDADISDEERKEKYLSELQRRTVQLVDNMRWNACLTHITKQPTLDNPKTTFINEGFRVAPRQISSVVFDFYVKPEKAIFAYTEAPGDRNTGAGKQIIFDKNKSSDIPFPQTLKNEFIVRLGEAYGLFTRDQFMVSFNNNQKVSQ